MKQSEKRSILMLHIAVMLFGLSGVVGKYVSVSAVSVAGGRVLFSSTILFLLLLASKEKLRLFSLKDYGLITLAGVILAIHWTSFFQSIQISSVAIGTITFSTFPIFLILLEPLIYKERITIRNIIFSAILLIGVFITVPEFSFGNQRTMGILWGMISSLTYAILSLLNRYLSGRYSGRKVSFYEQLTAAVVLFPFQITMKETYRVQDIMGIACIGILCTAIAFSLFVSAQKMVKAQTAGIISGMETVYGIAFAYFFLKEPPTIREIIGGSIILGVVLLSSKWESGS